MLEIFTQPLQFQFFQTAILASLLAGLIAPLLGNFIVASRQSVISDMLAHTALAGVGLGALFQLNPVLTAMLAVIISGVILWHYQKGNQTPDSLSMLLLTGGLALALLFVNLAPNTNINLENYLFGNILTLTTQDLQILIITTIIIFTLTILNWNNLIRLVFSPDYYESTSHKKRAIELLFILLVSFLVGATLKIIGGLLIGGLIIIPVLTAKNLNSNFQKTAVTSVLIGVSSMIAGLFLAFHLDIPTSSSIILLNIALFILSSFKK